ncbi:complement receptor type 2-like isoform X2 [Stegastes partitus]|uniref:Complement receptor type 2-like n=1 Tax=Stegastes partitus TaxID=144197 RepID=A0A3B5AXB1_9TELE|nr:PREDICTED: complement receptor type 2-like isoform X2 [Stegastes partitus]
MVVTVLLLLSCLLLAQAQNCSRPVGGPNMDLRDKDIVSSTFPDGSKASFKCNVGYRPEGGSATITCTAGRWSPVLLRCQIASCGPLEDVVNGIIDYPNDAVFGEKAVITCKPGFILVGSSEITCGDQGWMDRIPVCEVVQCDPPADIIDGKFSPSKESYAYREVVQYTCKSDYTINGSKSLSCSEDGTFKPAAPTCTRVQCKDPEIENGGYKEGARPPYKHSSSVTLQCNSGYVMKGTPFLTCDINSQWSPALPECELVECKEPKIENGKWKVGSGPPHKYSSTVMLECESGYSIIGESTQRCDKNGRWSPGLPQCKHSGGGGGGDDAGGGGRGGGDTISGGAIAAIVIALVGASAAGLGYLYFRKKKRNSCSPVGTTLLAVKSTA